VTVGVLGRRYASALFALADEAKQVDRIGRDLSDFAVSFKNSRELQAVFENPDFGAEVRRKILRDVATRTAMTVQVRNLLMLLSDRRRMRFVQEIADSYQALSEERSGKVRAEVVSATELPESYYLQLRQALEAVTGKQVVIDKKKDPELIGGVVTRVGGQVYDGSIRNRLSELKQELRSNTETLATGPEEAAPRGS
jgi:F-type H+-transporting ATPase subunit delta